MRFGISIICKYLDNILFTMQPKNTQNNLFSAGKSTNLQ